LLPIKSAAAKIIPISLEKSFPTELKAAPLLFNSSAPGFNIVKNS